MRPRHIGGLLVLFLLGMTAMRLAASYVSLVSGGAEILDLNFGNEATYIHNTLFALGGSGRDAYLHVYLLIDACYAVIYAVFYACTMAFFLRRIAPERWEWKRVRWVILLPMVAAACDWWENISFARMDPPIPHPREPAAGHQRHNSNNDEIHPRVPIAAAGAGVSCGLDSPAASGKAPPTTQNPDRLGYRSGWVVVLAGIEPATFPV